MNDELEYEEILTEEELEFLYNINKKIYEHQKNQSDKKYDHLDNEESLDFSDKHPDVIHKEHITDCPHEMRITVDTKVSAIDNKGYLSEVKNIDIKYYHIPIPSDTNYMEIVEKFFDTFQSKLLDTCKEIINPHAKKQSDNK